MLVTFRSERSTTTNYTGQFLGVQYFIDLSIIQYATSIAQDPSSVNVFLKLYIINFDDVLYADISQSFWLSRISF